MVLATPFTNFLSNPFIEGLEGFCRRCFTEQLYHDFLHLAKITTRDQAVNFGNKIFKISEKHFLV